MHSFLEHIISQGLSLLITSGAERTLPKYEKDDRPVGLLMRQVDEQYLSSLSSGSKLVTAVYLEWSILLNVQNIFSSELNIIKVFFAHTR